MKSLVLFLPLLLAACGADTTFPGRDPDQLWRALKAVAEQPDYDHEDPTKRWTVIENVVFVDEEERRINIDRRLRRLLHRPRTNPLYEESWWSFEVQQYPTDPPTVQFRSIDMALPTKAQFEADRFFNEVHLFLAGLPRPKHLRPSPAASSDDVPPS